MSAGNRKFRQRPPENSREVNSTSIWVGSLVLLAIIGILVGAFISLATGAMP